MDYSPDVEVNFEFTSATKPYQGYRPAHMLKEGCLTTGMHSYYSLDDIMHSGRGRGTITFIAPEDYPSCLDIGSRIEMREGKEIVGYATVEKIYNTKLQKEK